MQYLCIVHKQCYKWICMKLLYQLISKRLQRWYYYQELKELGGVAAIGGIIWLLYNYGKSILNFTLSDTGLIYLSFLLVAIVLGVAIKMYYRVIVIKYHEKDTNIQLFQNLNNNHSQK
jgi:hypothetical protein